MDNPKRARSGKARKQPRECAYVRSPDLRNALERIRQVVPSIYSSARTELAKLLIYGLLRKIRVLAQDAVANTDSKLLIYRLFQEGRVLAQDGIVPSIYSSASPWVGSQPCGAKYPGFCADSKGV